MGDVIVSMEHITKEFPGVKALDDVKFNLRSGEVMARYLAKIIHHLLRVQRERPELQSFIRN